MRSPVFSIIVPVYNAEHFIKTCLDSLLEQTYPEFELLLIDDGSTDRSGKICDEYAGRDSRIQVFHEKNKGVSASRNKGLQMASGKYVNFVDADDWVAADYLQSYVDARKDFDYDIVFTELVKHFNGEKSFTPLQDCSVVCPEDLSSVLTNLFDSGEFGYACNKSLKKEIIDCYRLQFDSRLFLNEDMVFMIDFCLNAQSVRLFPTQIYNYRIHFLSQSFNRDIDYRKYYLSCAICCDKSIRLAQKIANPEFYEAVRRYVLGRRRWAVLNMYMVNEIPKRKERLEYLKKLHDRFYIDVNGKGFVNLGLKIKNNLVADLLLMTIFTLARFLHHSKTS